MMVFLRVSAMLSIFPIFSSAGFPVQMRLGLGALIAGLVFPMVPAGFVEPSDMFGWAGVMAVEVLAGLVFGFSSRIVFAALDMAGTLISTEIGLQLPANMNPTTQAQTQGPGMILYYLAGLIWLGTDMHHWMLLGFVKTYALLPIGGAHISQILVGEMIHKTSAMFIIALQLTAPILAVSFIISLVCSVLGRSVPQMNVFQESFTLRILAGLTVFGMTMQLMAQHIINYLRALPEDILNLAQMLGKG
jgi:flagellar biosynthetic protein FliR